MVKLNRIGGIFVSETPWKQEVLFCVSDNSGIGQEFTRPELQKISSTIRKSLLTNISLLTHFDGEQFWVINILQ